MNWIRYSTCTLTLISLTWSLGSFAIQTEGLRGKRFCEVIISNGSIFDIYNTIHLNECPPENWSKLSSDAIKKETNSSYVVLNGPRQFTIDGTKNSLFMEDGLQVFQGLAMRKTGVLPLTMRETLYGSQPFHEHYVRQKTTWVYAPGKKIYELIDPKGRVYVMHSFSLSAVTRSEKDLVHLEKSLKLPRGWTWKAGILNTKKEVTTIQQQAIVIQDNMKNTYQLAAHDFLSQ